MSPYFLVEGITQDVPPSACTGGSLLVPVTQDLSDVSNWPPFNWITGFGGTGYTITFGTFFNGVVTGNLTTSTFTANTTYRATIRAKSNGAAPLYIGLRSQDNTATDTVDGWFLISTGASIGIHDQNGQGHFLCSDITGPDGNGYYTCIMQFEFRATITTGQLLILFADTNGGGNITNDRIGDIQYNSICID